MGLDRCRHHLAGGRSGDQDLTAAAGHDPVAHSSMTDPSSGAGLSACSRVIVVGTIPWLLFYKPMLCWTWTAWVFREKSSSGKRMFRPIDRCICLSVVASGQVRSHGFPVRPVLLSWFMRTLTASFRHRAFPVCRVGEDQCRSIVSSGRIPNEKLSPLRQSARRSRMTTVQVCRAAARATDVERQK